MNEFGYRSPMYGHFGEGCVHLRINFDLESEPGIRKFRAFLDQATDIVIAHGGSISGEHGDGQARATLLPKMFGPELMQAFREFKALWDPLNKMNPGKLVDPVNVYEPHENLRLGTGYQSAKVDTYFQFPDDKGSFAEATLRCIGVGACRKKNPGTMCPSYMATQEEQHSTRGRAHLLWELMERDVLDGDWGNEQVREALDLCLSCKACKHECPVNVDVATYKAEFLAHYHEKHSHHLRDYAFGFMDRWARLASVVPGITTRLANLPLQIPGVSSLVKQTLGIAPQRKLPRFAPRNYQSRLPANAPAQAEVLLWPDTWNNYYYPHVLESARQVLIDAGTSPYTPKHHVCCGRPLYDFGFLKEARAYLEKILHDFEPYINAGTSFVFLEPSCASVFRDELLNFFPTNAQAKRLNSQTLLLSQFLAQKVERYTPPSLSGQRIVLHGHCHHKSLMKMNDELAILTATGAEIQLLDSGCCGMAGPFGFEKEKYEVSQTLGERVLLPAVRSASPETLVVSDGFSCREQIAQNTDRRALHFAEVISNRPQQHS
jgi:Fe-S oxidoreductase